MSDSIPKISIITVCYQAGHLLRKTIDSVLEQTYKSIEYIIIDGASKDSTVELVNSYRNRISCFISEPDNGLYEAMNKGIQLATGDIVLFLNAGDYLITKDAIQFSISKMNFAQAQIFFGRFIWNDPITQDIVLSNHDWVTFTWDLQESNFPHPATFYKRHLFESIGVFDTSYWLGADYEWNMRALIKNKISFQYINIATTVFFADGLSNQKENAEVCIEENQRIFNAYLKPQWIYKLGFKHNGSDFNRGYYQKLIAKIYQCRLKRVYW
jgi:glycosyltransferase involved in cell wall biosynthesis